jgi:ribosomal protein RSM22 (predicted rRNA methylase)
MTRLNATVPPSLLDAVELLTAKEGLSRQNTARTVLDLSHRFTKNRDSLNERYLDDLEQTTAYLRYFFPVNYTKIRILLDEMPEPDARENFSVLDLGSGPGTGSLAVLDWWRRAKEAGRLTVSALDRSGLALSKAEQLWNAYCRKEIIEDAELRVLEADVERISWKNANRVEAPFDLIIIANCLNELHADKKDPLGARADFMKEILGMVAPHGTVMIVEPALRETSRALHQVRDRLIQGGVCNIYSPCLHERNCPALIKPDDWCHEERSWEPPESIRDIDREVGFIKDALKFSYLLLRRDGKTIVERGPDMYRVVSDLRVMKGEKRAWLCNERGRQEVGRQDRLASSQNQAFDQWHRGDIVHIGKIVHKERHGTPSALGRVEQEGAVRIIRPV